MYQEIHQAAAEGDVDTVSRLLEDGVDPSIKNSVSILLSFCAARDTHFSALVHHQSSLICLIIMQ